MFILSRLIEDPVKWNVSSRAFAVRSFGFPGSDVKPTSLSKPLGRAKWLAPIPNNYRLFRIASAHYSC